MSILRMQYSLARQNYYGWLIVATLLLRIAWAFLVPVVPISDSHAYDVFAQNIAQGNGYGWRQGEPTAYWPVGTSLIYAILYFIFGHHYLPIVILNLVLSGFIVWACMYLAETWFDRKAAIATGLLFALLPSQIQFTTVLASELIFNALVLLALVFWFNFRLMLWQKAIFAGIALAAASYVRPTAMLLVILLLFIHWLQQRQPLLTLKAGVIMVTLLILLIAPWSIRNTTVFGQFVTISTNGGANLWMGNNPNSTGGYMELPEAVAGMNEAVRDTYLKQQAIAYIKEAPGVFVINTGRRLFDTYSRQTIGIAWNEAGLTARYGAWILAPLKLWNQLFWMGTLGLGVVGAGCLVRSQGWFAAGTHTTIVLWAYFTAIHAFIVSQDRYNFPSVPMIVILGGFAIACWSGRQRSGARE
jgi:4-amino-4-deoxy-L-arabinose transferase-like glycosyltransferase